LTARFLLIRRGVVEKLYGASITGEKKCQGKTAKLNAIAVCVLRNFIHESQKQKA
jgi:hypothetical protein